jgi:fibronectin type 3 domain-containing protein
MKALFFTFQLLLVGVVCVAQSTTQSIVLIGRSYPDHVVLRYFPTSPSLLSKANVSGYIIEKAVFKPGIAKEKLAYMPIKGGPFKRWADDVWEKNISAVDKADTLNIKMAGLAMTLTGTDVKAAAEDVMAGGLKSLMEERDNQDMKFAFVLIAANRSVVAAEGVSLRVTDNDIKAGVTYVYRVKINDPNIVESAYVNIKAGSFNSRYLANNKTIKVNEGDQKINFTFPESKEYYAFNVDRSDDGGATYKRITGTPKIKLTPHGYTGKTDFGFVDSSLVNYKKYQYRVLVATPFADDLLLGEFKAMPRDKTPPPSPFLKTVTHIKPKQVELIWETTPAPDLKGFTIKRSNTIRGKYTLISKAILPNAARSYIDETFDATGNNYYVVEAIDTAGNISSSFPAYVTLIDSIPPDMPTITSAKIDTVGKIIIKIKPNIEKDFIGYQLLKANARDHEFSVVTETYKDSLGKVTFTLKDSTTLNTLTKNIYYQVIAFDSHFNQSKPSKIIALKKRDTIPPVSPLITNYNITDSTVVLTFANSPSEDAVSNALLRREVGKAKYDTVFNNRNKLITSFIDKKIIGGREYEYAMTAKDDGGLSSKIGKTILIKTQLNNRIPAPVISGTYDAQTKKIALSFKVDDKLKSRKLKIEIYKRASLTAGWIAYKIIDMVPGKAFLDDTEGGQQSMYYTVRLADENKNNSIFSNELEIKL